MDQPPVFIDHNNVGMVIFYYVNLKSIRKLVRIITGKIQYNKSLITRVYLYCFKSENGWVVVRQDNFLDCWIAGITLIQWFPTTAQGTKSALEVLLETSPVWPINVIKGHFGSFNVVFHYLTPISTLRVKSRFINQIIIWLF